MTAVVYLDLIFFALHFDENTSNMRHYYGKVLFSKTRNKLEVVLCPLSSKQNNIDWVKSIKTKFDKIEKPPGY